MYSISKPSIHRKTLRKKMFSSVLLAFLLLMSFAPFAMAVAPSAPPTDVTISNIYGTSARVNWTKSVDTTNAVGYNVYIDGVLEKSVGDISYAYLTGLTGLTSYDVTVTARDSGGLESSPTTVVPFTTLDASATIAMNFDISQMFQWAQMIIDVLMPVIYITMGIALGFIVIRALKSAFN